LAGSANRDHRRFVDGDTFNIHREQRPHVAFGHGIHACIGAILSRLEGRVALEEVLKRFPEWHVDHENAELAQTSTVRGWESLPVFIGPASRRVTTSVPTATPMETKADVPPATTKDVPLEGTWNLVVKGPTGPQATVLVIEKKNGVLVGTQTGQGSTSAVTDCKVDGTQVSWINHVHQALEAQGHVRR
jgi:hypothetical protein